MPLLEKNLDKLDWKCLSWNPAAISLLEKNVEKVDWTFLSGNTAAISLLEKNPDKIDWCRFSWNSNIFEMDPEKYKKDLNSWEVAVVDKDRGN
jgi:hypothetical protein